MTISPSAPSPNFASQEQSAPNNANSAGDIEELLGERTEPQSAEDGELAVGPDDEMGRQDFLQLLTTQLQVQDPLNPMEAEEMAAQLAQFSSVEQLININDTLEQQGGNQGQLAERIDSSMASNLLGKQVQADGNQIEFTGDGEVPITFDLAADASDTTVTVLDRAGQEVYTQEMGSLSEGNHEFMWNGENENGEEMPPGTYAFRVDAQDAEGDRVEASTLLSGQVDRVTFGSEQTLVQVGDTKVPLDQIRNVRE